MTDDIATNAASSGVTLDRKVLKAVAQRSDRPGLTYLAVWISGLAVTGALVMLSRTSAWVWPVMVMHGILLTVPAYALSHETAHGTAFRTRWMNEAVLWLTSLIYMEEPLHRRYTHTNHHTYTWHVGKDNQMPFDTPMTLGGWLIEVSGVGLLRFHVLTLLQASRAQPSAKLRSVTPAGEMPRMIRNARIFIAIYASFAALVAAGVTWPLWLLILPRLLGAPVMLLFTLTQHVELSENHPSILESTRSFRAGRLGRWLYANMHHHVEHHLYPQVPFYALPALATALEDQVPAPDPGFFRFNWEVLRVVTLRSLGRRAQANGIRQAAHMVNRDAHGPIARRSM